MSASNVSSPWFQGDYRCSSPFRGGGKAPEWGVEKDDKLAIAESAVVDSGAGSMSPSPPKTPTPDYDSLEDIFGDDRDSSCSGILDSVALTGGQSKSNTFLSCTRILDDRDSSSTRIHRDSSCTRIIDDRDSSFNGIHRDLSCTRILDDRDSTRDRILDSLPAIFPGQHPASKKVHFSSKVTSPLPLDITFGGDSICDDNNKSINKSVEKSTNKSKSSWRDALVVSPVDQLSFCYRQDWAKSKSLKTAVGGDRRLDGTRRQSSGRSRKRRVVRRSSSLDRLSELRYSYRTPLLCDPDPLKERKDIEGSSHKPVGPQPPLKQLRSYSVENTHSSHFASACSHLVGGGRATRQRSVSGNVSCSNKKTPVRRVDDEALKRSRLHSSQYELSQDLLDKQVEMLERKYGGVCARKAALTIQRAFRKYTIMKRFQDIANASKGERRLSRRFPTFDLENKEWVVHNSNGTVSRYPHHFTNTQHNGEVKVWCNNFHSANNNSSDHPAIYQSNQYDVLYNRELSENLESNDARFGVKPPCRTQSFRERRINKYEDSYGQEANHCGIVRPHLNSAYYGNKENVQNSSGAPLPSFPRHPAWSAVVPNNIHRTSCNVYSSPIQQDASFLQPVPRDSVSSEDSALSLMSIEMESGELLNPNIHRGSAVRHSINVVTSPSSSKHQGSLMQRSAGQRASDVALGRRVAADQKKIPPQVPKRTSSIPSGTEDGQELLENSQSLQKVSGKTVDASPVWKRKSLVLAEQSTVSAEDKRLSNISENSEDSLDSGGGYSNTAPADMSHSFNVHNYPDVRTPHDLPTIYKLTEIQRKRQYRVGLNLFNKKPERGVRYLIQRGFLEAAPQAVARFLLTRKGLSKQMIGEYLGNLQNSFNMAVLECFVQELDLAGMQVDVALRKFQTFFRMPGEAQKIERLVEVFSHRYIDCNHDIASKFHNPDTVFVLAFAIIMLNTDLHTPNMKAERRMKLEEFIKNLRSIDDGSDLDRDMLIGIYERIKTNEFKMGSDHVTQVLKVQQTIVGKKPNLALPHRRLVCYCRLYEVYDVSKKERPGVHQREVFLFNDLLMVTKIFSKKKNSVTYTFRQSFPLCGMSVTLFDAPYYPHGIRLSQRVDDKVLITFNARNEHDRSKFVEDLKESILEMDEMENLRIEGELEKQKMMRVRGAENRDSGVGDMGEILPPQPPSSSSSKEGGKLSPESAANNLKRSALSNSLLDLHEQQINKPVRRGSAGSLDSGMSISFQSSAASSVSHDSSPQIVHASSTSSGSGSSLGSNRSGDPTTTTTQPPQRQPQQSPQAGFLGGWFLGKKSKASSNLRKTPEDA